MNRLLRILFSFLVIGVFWMGLSTHSAFAASCPVTDGGVGDGDGSADGTITINASTTWTPADATTWDCSGKTVLVTNNSTLTFASSTTLGYYGWLTADNLTIDSGSTITSNAKGCAPSAAATYDGLAPNASNICTQGASGSGDGSSTVANTRSTSGGGYGGAGGAGTGGIAFNGAASVQHHTYQSPLFFGSSAGSHTFAVAGTGGGIVRLTISGTFTHNGTVSSNGTAGTSGLSGVAPGGGSGGSVYIDVGVLAGTTGTFSATGGAGYVHSSGPTTYGGGGGGGRIAVYYASKTMTLADATFSVAGGAASGSVTGGEGTVYVKDTSSSTVTTYGTFWLSGSTAYSETTWEFDSGATVGCLSGTTAPTLSATTLTLGGVWACSDSSMASISFSASSAFTVGSGTSMSFPTVGTDVDFDIPAGSSQTWTNFTFTGAKEGFFTINDAASVTIAGTSVITANVNWTNLVDLTTNATTTISANSLGCSFSSTASGTSGSGPNGSNVCAVSTGGYGTGHGTNGGGGGAYGGNGGAGGSGGAGGTPYGVINAPTLLGSSGGNGGGASGRTGGPGGGAIRIQTTGTFTHEGPLTATGGAGTGAAAQGGGGGGSGGAVYVTATTLAGTTGTFSVQGGTGGSVSGNTADGGSGSGGHVAVICTTCTFLPTSSAMTISGGSAVDGGAAGGTGSGYVENTTTNAANFYGNFALGNDTYNLAPSVTFATTSTLTCTSAAVSPVISAYALTLGGTLTCTAATGLTSLTLTATTGVVDMASGTVINANITGANLNINLGAGSSSTWTGVTITGGAKGRFVMDDAASVTIAGTSAITANVNWTNLVDLTTNSTTTISANSYGCTAVTTQGANGYGPNISNVCTLSAGGAGLGHATAGASGGGHAGLGGNAASPGNTGGVPYGIIAAPVLFGSSGGSGGSGASQTGGTGGGAIRVDATGTFTHNGPITATGGAGVGGNANGGGGGGSGGSIYVTAGTLAGSTGTFSVAGGAGGASTGTADAGGGSGGRVAVSCTTCTYAQSSSSFTLTAGASGGGGSLVGSVGSAYYENITTDASVIYGNFAVDNSTYSFSRALTLDTAGTQNCGTAAATPVISADSITMGGTFTCTSSGLTSLTLTATTGGVNMASGTTINANVAGAALNINLAAASSSTWTAVTITGGARGSFAIDDAASISIAGTSPITANISWTNLVDLTLSSGTTLSANALGCATSAGSAINGMGPNGSNVCTISTAGYGAGKTPQGGGGGGYGGVGGTGSSGGAGGAVFGSAGNPTLFGSSGGNGATYGGGNGGGLIKISATGTVTHNGIIKAIGGAGTNSNDAGAGSGGGGSGGAINITAVTFTGTTGTFLATGGAGGNAIQTTADGGSGAGGRIAVIVGTDSSSFLASQTAASDCAGGTISGATGTGAVGTFYLGNLNSPGPVMTAAVTGDNDADGQIDRIVVTFDKDVSSGTVAGSDFLVTGYTVSSASRTASATVTIVMTESGAGDSGATPVVLLVGSIADGSGVTSADGTQTPTDGVAPVRTSQSYKDIDSNGVVDRIDVVYSETLTLDECDSADYTFTGADLGSIVLSSCATSTTDLRLTVTGAASNRTNLTLNIAYTASAGTADSIHDAANNNAATYTAQALSDGASPIAISASYKDITSPNNGTVDRVDVLFTETVTVTYATADWSFTAPGSLTLNDTNAAASTSTIQLTVTADAMETSSSSTPTLQYTNGAARLKDAANNAVATFGTALNVSDAAAPVISSISMEESGTADGLIDKLTIVWSENVDTDDGAAPVFADFGTITMPDSVSATSATITDPAGASATVVLTSVLGQVTPNTANTSLAINGITTQWTDGTNVTSNPDDNETKLDLAAPVAISASYKDVTSVDGMVDRVDILFSETLAALTYNSADWSFPAAGDMNLVRTGATISTNTVRVSTTADLLETGSTVTPTVLYTNAGNRLGDGSGNKTATFGSALNVTDGASGFLINTGASKPSYLDTATADGRIDRVQLNFTEAVTISYTDSAWTATANGLTSFDVGAYHSGSGTATLYLTATAAANLTGVSGGTEPTLAFNGSAGYVRDASSNAITFSATSLVDAAAALPTLFSYRDATGADGRVDRIDVTFTERPVVGDCAPSDYTMGGGDMGIIAVSACAVSGSDLQLTITGAPATTTALTITLAYNAANGTANSLKDTTAVAIPSFGPSDITDGTSPIRVSQQYVDNNGNGTVDRFDILFSEPITVDECESGDFAFTGADASAFALSGCASSGSTVQLAVTGGAVDTEVTVSLAYTQAAGVANSLHDATGNNVINLSASALTDGAAPILMSASYKDVVSVNGTVDRVDAVYSEALTLDECDSADYTFGGTDLGSIALGSCAVSTTTLQLTITGAPANDTNLALTLGYVANGGTANSIHDGNNNNTANTSSAVTLSDAAAPIAISAAYKDTGTPNGTVDRVDVLFSEDLSLSSYNASDWSFPAAGSLNLTDSSAASSLLSSTIQVAVSADTGETSSTSTPTVLYTNNGGRLTDGTNAVTTFGSALNVTDSAAPAIRTLTIEETGTANGLIDKITILWSENLDTDDGAAPVIGDFGTILLPDGSTVSSATISDPAGASSTVVLTSVAGQVTPNTAAGATAIDGITTQWTDGTNATSNPDDAESITDSAAPFLRTDGSNAAAYQDNNADGTIDRVKLVFTESTTMTYADADWTATANNLTSFDVSGISSGNNSSTIYLTGTAASNLTGVGSGIAPTLAFTASGGSIADGSTNALASISSRSLADAASPILLSNSPANGSTGVSTTANLVLTFSESINTGTAAVSLSETPTGLSSAWTVSDSVLTLSNTGGFTPAGSVTVTVTTAADATGNAFGGGDTGVTHPFTFTISADSAPPVLQSGSTADNDSNGHIDRIVLTFNEDMDGATVAGSDFTVTGYTISSASRSASATVTIVLTELVSYDTSARPSTSLVGSISDSGGNAATSGTITPTDGAAPVAVSASYKDTGTPNGTVDRVDILFSEAMTLSSYNASDWSFPAAGSLNLVDSSAAASSSTIQVSVSADTGETSSTSTPTVLYTNNANRLTDGTNALTTFGSALNVSDSAAPAIRTVTTEDTGTANGLIDKLTILWTENVDTDDGSAPVLGDFGNILLPDGQAVSSASISDPAGSSASVVLTSVVGQVTPNTAAGSTAIDGITTQWTDGTNATSNPDDAESITDSAKPFLRTDGSNAARYEDNNADGTIDRVKLVFTESTTITYSDSDWTATANDLTSFDVSGISSGNNSSTIYLTGTATSNLTGVGAGTQPTLAFTAAGGSIADGSTNALTSISSRSLVDAASPLLLSSLPADDAIDVLVGADLVLNFSEPIVTGTAAYTFNSAPSGLSDTWSVGDTRLTVSHSGSFTNGASMVFTMTTAADATGNAFGGGDTGVGHPIEFVVISLTNPTLISSSTRDSDANGYLDRMVIVMSEDIVPESVAGSDFTVTGYTVTSASRSATSTVTIVLTEKLTTDTSATPEVNVVGSVSGSDDGTITSGSTTPSDAAAPVRLSQSYKDVVSVDGRVDRVDILYSEALTLDECDTADYTFGGADLGSIVLSSCAVSTTTLQLTVTGAPANDTNLALTLGYTAGAGTANSIHDAANNNAATYTGAVPTDAAAPIAISAAYKDTGVSPNGTVDRVDVLFSEAMILSSYSAGDWSFPGAGSLNLADSGAASSSSTVQVAVSADTGETSSTSTPTVLYTNNAGSLTDAIGNAATTFGSALNITDSAAPAIRTITMEDTGTANGLIDKLTILWSETVDTDDGSAPVLADFGTMLLPDGQTVSSATISDPAGASATVTLTSVAGQVTPNTAAGSTAINGITTQWTDGTNATSNPDDAETVTDSAKPIALSGLYRDIVSADGQVDKVFVSFSEATTVDGCEVGDYTFGGANGTGVEILNCGGSGTNSLSFEVSGTPLLNTAPSLTFNYSASAGIANALTDTVNTVDSITDLTLSDDADPLLMSGVSGGPRYQDNNANGTVDRMKLNFTEAVTITYADSDWTISANSLTSFDVSAIDSGNGTATVYLTATAAANLTGIGSLAEPTLAFTATGGSILDAASNALSSVGTTTVRDGAAPLALSATSKDIDLNGQIDRIDVAFTEVIAYDECEAGDYSFTGTDSTGVAVSACAFSATDARFTVTGAPAEDTALSASILYDKDAGVAYSLDDGSSNGVEDFTLTPSDSAAPHLSSITIQDTDVNGFIDTLLLIWSENIDRVDGAAPVLANFGTILLPDGQTVSAATISDPAGASSQITMSSVTGQTLRKMVAGSTAISGITTGWWDGTNETSNPDEGVDIVDDATDFIFHNVVSTSTTDEISTTSAQMNGNVTDLGMSLITAHGFEYGHTTAYGSTAAVAVADGFTTGSYAGTVSSLSCGTTYHFRAYATNTEGTSYGEDATFTTSSCPVSGSSGGSAGTASGAGGGSSSGFGGQSSGTSTSSSFIDIEGLWSETYIEKLVESCGVEGYKDENGNLINEFGPNNPVTRAEAIKIMVGCERFKTKTPNKILTFTDVSATAWYAPYMEVAYEKSWVQGYEDSTCKPNQSAVREEAVKMVVEAAYKSPLFAREKGTIFRDVPRGAWYTKFIEFAAQKGIVSGYKNKDGKLLGIFGVGDQVTRAEFAKIAVEAFKL